MLNDSRRALNFVYNVLDLGSIGKVSPGNTTKEVVRICENVKVITNPTGTHVTSVVELGRWYGI